MPWHCPACNSHIRLKEIEVRPRADEPYRCPTCRLELRFNEASERMEIAPFEADHIVSEETSERVRGIPTPIALPKKPDRRRIQRRAR
jgi:hypothetical protein